MLFGGEMELEKLNEDHYRIVKYYKNSGRFMSLTEEELAELYIELKLLFEGDY